MKETFDFYTEYHQFYLEDREAKTEINSVEFWNEEALSDGLALENGIIGIGTKSYGNIKGDIEFVDKPKNVDFSLYDHVVEGSIKIESGELQVLDCTAHQVQATLKLEPGYYRVRIYGSNFASVTDDDIANDSDDDYYKIVVWKASAENRKVLKQYNWGF